MNIDEMPATEEQAVVEEGEELSAYECSYHLLPTVAEGEVERMVEDLISIVTAHGGEVFDSEAPQRIPLAYVIKKMTEGRSEKCTHAWFGWFRMRLAPSQLAGVLEELAHRPVVLRHLIVRLTKAEEAKPFRVFEKKAETATVLLSDATSEVAQPVSEEDLNKSLEQITS